MKVTGLRATPFPQGCCIELNTDEGLVGIAVTRADVNPLVSRLVDEVLLGEDPRAVVGHWEKMTRACGESGGVAGRAIAALDMALWDLKAKARGEPLWVALGGSQSRLQAHVTVESASLSDTVVAERYTAMARDYGFKSGKLIVGADQAADLRRLALMKQALQQNTAEPGIMIDAEELWSPKESVRHVREMEQQFDLTWVEGTARRWDYLGHKRVSSAVRAAVCAGERLGSLGEFLPHFKQHSLDIIQLNLATCGITGALQVADAAFGLELPVVLSHSPGNVGVHLGAVMPYCMSVEVLNPEPADGVFTTAVRIQDGCAIAGARPGNGLVLNGGAES